ncbi:MAG: flagellar assembly protein FliW [Chlamydiales bacterium]|nr:flagellar assembly protein FliW [Chlamydiales bacterium]
MNFPKGLHGFESLTRFFLIGHRHEIPFLRLVSEDEAVTFMVIDPFPINPLYEPVITKRDLDDLNVVGSGKLIILTVVDMKGRPLTTNLEGPLLIHWRMRQGKQLLFPDDPAYPIEN